MKNTQLVLKRKILNDNPKATKIEIKKMEKDILNIKGVFIPDDKGKEIEKFNDYETEYINQQINYLIRKKYNFIHYNPFPRVSTSTLTEFIEEDEEEDDYDLLLDDKDKKKLNTENKKIVDNLEKKLKNNIKKHYIKSPFHNETIIIDEVHNLVRQILNDNSSNEALKR